MSAANASAQSPSLQEEMRAHEPSMEEILASIRRIIADDDTFPAGRREREDRRRREDEPAPASAAHEPYPAPAPEPAPKTEPAKEWLPQPAPVAEIRQLRLNRSEPDYDSEPADKLSTEEGSEEQFFEEQSDFPVALMSEPEHEPLSYVAEADAPLVSADTASSVATHFQALAASMIINDSGLLQKYAQDMMRPLLKQWLDDNLPIIVERLVRAEIERVARGGRR